MNLFWSLCVVSFALGGVSIRAGADGAKLFHQHRRSKDGDPNATRELKESAVRLVGTALTVLASTIALILFVWTHGEDVEEKARVLIGLYVVLAVVGTLVGAWAAWPAKKKPLPKAKESRFPSSS